MQHPRGRGERGLALATIVYVAFVLLLFGLTLAVTASFAYQSVHRQVSQRQAMEAAQAGLALAIYQVADDPAWGTRGETLAESVGDSGTRCTVSFQPGPQTAWSTNNLQGSTGVAGYRGQPVPPFSALIVSEGTIEDGRQAQKVEALIQLAPYPYAIATSGGIQCTGAMTIRGTSSLAQLQQGVLDVPGSIYSGGSGIAVRAGTISSLTGEARAVGTLSLPDGSVADRGMESGVTPESLPNIDIASFNNANSDGVTLLAPGNYTAPIEIRGPTFVDGSLNLHGGAHLASANLYVTGNVNATGELQGNGSIFVCGRTLLHSNMQLVSTSTIAVFSQGDLNMQGEGFFQGLLYSHGDIKANASLHVVGGVIAQSDTGSAGLSVTGPGSNIVVTYLPEYMSFGRSWVARSSGDTPVVRRVFWGPVP